jgi:hypothetical protein
LITWPGGSPHGAAAVNSERRISTDFSVEDEIGDDQDRERYAEQPQQRVLAHESSSATGSVLDRIGRAIRGMVDLLPGAFGRSLVRVAGRQDRRRGQRREREGS